MRVQNVCLIGCACLWSERREQANFAKYKQDMFSVFSLFLLARRHLPSFNSVYCLFSVFHFYFISSSERAMCACTFAQCQFVILSIWKIKTKWKKQLSVRTDLFTFFRFISSCRRFLLFSCKRNHIDSNSFCVSAWTSFWFIFLLISSQWFSKRRKVLETHIYGNATGIYQRMLSFSRRDLANFSNIEIQLSERQRRLNSLLFFLFFFILSICKQQTSQQMQNEGKNVVHSFVCNWHNAISNVM